jgi:hypothetical protein
MRPVETKQKDKEVGAMTADALVAAEAAIRTADALSTAEGAR